MMQTLSALLEAIADLLDMVTHPRFYLPLLCGIGVAAAAWHWMPPGDARDVLALGSVLVGLAVGVVWDWGH
jgi:hypothetical protein